NRDLHVRTTSIGETNMSQKRLRFVAVLAAAFLTVAACSGSQDDPPEAADTPSQSTGQSDQTPAATDEFDPNASLVIGDNFQSVTIDPALNDAGTGTRHLNLVYDRLIGIDPDGELVPQLATKWEFTSESEFVLTLRDDVTF